MADNETIAKQPDGRYSPSAMREILVVDGSGADFEIFVIAAKVAGITRPIRWAHSVDQALELMSRRPQAPGLILLDVDMAGGEGLELLRRLRADPDYRDTPVVILTASSDEERQAEASRLGCQDYLFKPVVWTGYERIAERIRFILSESDRMEGRFYAA